MSRSPGLGSGPSTRRRLLMVTAWFVTGWAVLLRLGATGRAVGAASVDINCPEGWLETKFTGTSRFTTTYPDADSDDPISIGVAFSPARDQVCISSFPPIDAGRATVTYAGGPLGTFDSATGDLTIALTLHFDVDAGPVGMVIDEDSNLPISLSTGDRRASRVNRTSGEATLVGTSAFQGGDVLSGYEGTLVLEGKFSPNPLSDGLGLEEPESSGPQGPSEPGSPGSTGGALEAVLHVMMQ